MNIYIYINAQWICIYTKMPEISMHSGYYIIYIIYAKMPKKINPMLSGDTKQGKDAQKSWKKVIGLVRNWQQQGRMRLGKYHNFIVNTQQTGIKLYSHYLAEQARRKLSYLQ